jgi:hypothetical protein
MAEQITSTQIADAAVAPASATIDGQTFNAHRLPDLIEVDKHLAAKRAMADPSRAIRRVRYIPPGGND